MSVCLDELQSDLQMLKEEVDEEDIAEIVSKWTGIPVSRLMEGEMAKLVRMEDVLHARGIGQDEAVTAAWTPSCTCGGSPRTRRGPGGRPPPAAPAPDCRTRIVRSDRFSSSARRGW